MTELEKLRGFLKKHTRKTGSPYEQDAISQLIFSLISAIGEQNRQTVLVIDDLDRIDPEHIFRILNVFAAHFDIDENENKFGFDRIILVCDIQNIRRIFRNRYGQDTDFSGYIDKFYSRRVFVFNNRDALEEAVSKVLSSLKITSIQSLRDVANNQTPVHKFMVYILHGMVRAGGINLRSVWKVRGKAFHYEPDKGSFYFCSSPGLFQILVHFAGDVDSLRDGLKRCVAAKIWKELSDREDESHKHKLGFVLPILTRAKGPGNRVEQESYQLSESHPEITFQIHPTGDGMKDLFANVQAITQNGNAVIPDFFQYLLETVNVLELSNQLR